MVKRFIKLLRNLKNYFINILSFIQLSYFKVETGTNIKINGLLFIRNNGFISLGNNVKINSSFVSNPIGYNLKTSLVVYENAKLKIADNTGISNSLIVCSKQIDIGSNCMIGGDTKIYDTDFHSLNIDERTNDIDNDIIKKEIRIEDNVFIGSGSIILKGVVIGENSIVGAGSVVAKDIPKNQIWAGNPARYIRDL